MTWILHASDPHLGDVASVALDDEKEGFDQADLETTQRVFQRTLKTLPSFVARHGRPAVAIFSGDLTFQSHPSGFDAFAALLDDCADVLPEERKNIVVTPGNHDVVWSEPPGSETRYAGFLACTRDRGCATPLIDGVDLDVESGALLGGHDRSPHIVQTTDVLVVPINSSNWCGAMVQLRGAMTLDEWEAALDPAVPGRDRLLADVRRLHQRDMARLSRAQMDALREHLEGLCVPHDRADDPRVRVAVLHHQLLPVSTREERKASESLMNLGLMRETVAAYGFDLVLHGHKHENGMYWDLAGGSPDDLNAPRTRALVLSSPGHFDVDEPVMRAIHIEGSPRARSARIVTFAGPRSGRRTLAVKDEQLVPLWPADVDRREQTTIHANDADQGYARLRSLFALRNGTELRNVVCQIDDPTGADLLPPDYPKIAVDDSQAWFTALVDWWQQERSELVSRSLLGFNHGERIRRRWGDQIERAARLLDERGDSSRALVQLVAPRETGRYDDDERDLHRGSFPAFVVGEFSLAERDGTKYLDCFAYFRKQEMQFWWPVNLAELARLQADVRKQLQTQAQLGRIVTFSAVALWKDALPRVAVPLIDLMVEDPGRLLSMALALAFPDRATDDAVRDWRDVLRDLAGTGRSGPPKVSAGAQLLLQDLGRLQQVSASAHLNAVFSALETLVEAYEPYVTDEDLPPKAQTSVSRRVATLADSVTAVLPEATP